MSETLEAGRELDALVAEQVMGISLEVPRERAMAMLGAMYVRVTGPEFKLDVHGYDVKVAMPPGDTIPAHESDDNFNQRYFRHAVAELLAYPNEIGELVARDLAQIRATPKPYSTDIAAAWEVVEALRNRHLFVEVTVRPGGLSVEVVVCDGFKDRLPVGREVYADADTAPLAICRAALKALASPTEEGSR